ncbi:MAG: hypothetical protein Q9221_004809 [Calogaya cf. arnoldii]
MHSSLLSVFALLAAGTAAGPIEQIKSRDNGGFCNTVFNTDACQYPGWMNTWDTLSSHGVANFFAFTLGPLSEKGTYNITKDTPCPEPPNLEAARIPMITDPTERFDAFKKIESFELPFLELYNEPDFSFLDVTPVTSPADSAEHLKPLIDMNSYTTLISPAPAFTGDSWLQDFAEHCTGCMDKIGIVAAHVYSVDSTGAIDQIKMLHDRWPDKKIWVTELAPSTGGNDGDHCPWLVKEMKSWMTEVVTELKKLDYVEKIFWNTGAWVCAIPSFLLFTMHGKQ